MAPPRVAAVLSLCSERAAGARLRVLRGQPSIRSVQRRRAAADVDFPGAPRCVSRSSNRRAVRQRAPERHPVAARRRPSADREPAADVERHPTVHGVGRVSRALKLGLAVAVAYWVQGSGFRVQGSAVPETRSVRVGFQNSGGGYTVTSIPIETYVARVLAGEAMRDSQPAALEALAITIRTFAAANLRRHGADGFDLCDQTHCQ